MAELFTELWRWVFRIPESWYGIAPNALRATGKAFEFHSKALPQPSAHDCYNDLRLSPLVNINFSLHFGMKHYHVPYHKTVNVDSLQLRSVQFSSVQFSSVQFS